MMTREDALRWYGSISEGSYPDREWYRQNFPIGKLAENLWNKEPIFQYGLEYGIMIAIAKIYELTPRDTGQA